MFPQHIRQLTIRAATSADRERVTELVLGVLSDTR
jgi:hypothetical protein